MDSIREHRVEVHYQPIYSTVSKGFESAEALVRIRREDGSIMMPGSFIEVAEKRGSILPLGAEVFDKVCQFIEEQLKIMEALGIQYIQGYYFSKPLPENKFIEFVIAAIGEKNRCIKG